MVERFQNSLKQHPENAAMLARVYAARMDPKSRVFIDEWSRSLSGLTWGDRVEVYRDGKDLFVRPAGSTRQESPGTPLLRSPLAAVLPVGLAGAWESLQEILPTLHLPVIVPEGSWRLWVLLFWRRLF